MTFKAISNINNFFKSDFKYVRHVSVFRKTLYVYLFINTLLCLPEFSFIWGEYGFVAKETLKDIFSLGNVGRLLSFSDSSWIPISLIFIQLLSLVIGWQGFYRKTTSILIWITTFNLFNPIHLAATGGEVLIHILLFYFIFIDERKKDSLSTLLNNTFFWLSRWQIVILYFFAGFYKLYDNNWLNGDALYYIIQIDAFSRPWATHYLEGNIILLKLFTYGTLIYQLSFPFAIWWKKIKTPFLIVGIIFHLSIAFIAGVFSFGIIMIISYILWWNFKSKPSPTL